MASAGGGTPVENRFAGLLWTAGHAERRGMGPGAHVIGRIDADRVYIPQFGPAGGSPGVDGVPTPADVPAIAPGQRGLTRIRCRAQSSASERV
jgi:hypothetical protein